MAFKPGESGNAGGRPKKSNPASMAAKQHALEAIEYQAFVMRDKTEKTENRLKAAEHIITRAYGKPQEYVEHTADQDQVGAMEDNIVNKLLSSLPTETLQKLADEYSRPDDYTVRH